MSKTEASMIAASATETAKGALSKMDDLLTHLDCAADLMIWLGASERNADLKGAEEVTARVKDNGLYFVSLSLVLVKDALGRHQTDARAAVGILSAAAVNAIA